MIDSQMRLLVVDDDILIQAALSQVFSGIGYQVQTAHDGFSALAEIERELPDILVSDLYMPGMSGFEFLPIVRRRFPSVRVIAMSATYTAESLPAGVIADRFHPKDAGLEFLLQAVEAMAKPVGSLPKRLRQGSPSRFRMYEKIPPRPAVKVSMRQRRRTPAVGSIGEPAQ
jgi:CheY-like chemotaxis protein